MDLFLINPDLLISNFACAPIVDMLWIIYKEESCDWEVKGGKNMEFFNLFIYFLSCVTNRQQIRKVTRLREESSKFEAQ